MQLCLVNKTTLLPQDVFLAQFAPVVAALNVQMVQIQKAWGRVSPYTVTLDDGVEWTVPTLPMILLDNADQAGALGYHAVTPHGNPYSRVFVETILRNGGTMITGANSVSACLSHEAAEAYQDPYANRWAGDGKGKLYAIELCDPVENDSYEINGVGLSDFVFPAYFNPWAAPEVQLDFLNLVRKPFEVRPGGYAIVMNQGSVHQVWGAEYPVWKRISKRHAAARAVKRQSMQRK